MVVRVLLLAKIDLFPPDLIAVSLGIDILDTTFGS